MNTLEIPLYKLCGTGNSFIFADNTSPEASRYWERYFNSREEMVQKICNPAFGIGSDGFVFVESTKNSEADLMWDFYNSDGSRAEMCGNAARCMGLFCVEQKLITNNKFCFESLAGIIKIHFKNSQNIAVEMPPIKNPLWNESIEFNHQVLNYHFINSGVPHAVFFINDINESSQKKDLAQFVRSHKKFSPQGTNVTFVQVLDKNNVKSISFERGVENYTLACGTGAVASAFALLEKTPDTTDVSVEVPGGQLKVQLKDDHPVKTGPAQFISKLKLYGDML